MANPMKASVTIVLQPSKSPPFQMKSGLLQGKDLAFTNLNFPGFSIDFSLEDPERSGYLFPANPSDAFAAKEIKSPTDSCPDQGQTFSELVPENVSANYKTLTVRNYNSYACNFGFSLFVTKDPQGNGPYLKLDPIGANHNGPRTAPNRRLATVAIAIAAIIVIAFVLNELGVFTF
jgi:hypothetical protein